MDKKLTYIFKKHPDAFWLDMLLHCYEYTINGKVAFNTKSTDIEFNRISQESKGQLFYKTSDIPIYFSKLLSDGLIESKGEGFMITHKGLSHIMIDGGYIEQAIRSHKETKRFDFEYFKIGYDTVVSTLAFILSIIAILLSLK
jgi:hypothetical protein